MATPRDLAFVTSRKRTQERIESMTPLQQFLITPAQRKRSEMATRRMRAASNGYFDVLTREELARKAA